MVVIRLPIFPLREVSVTGTGGSHHARPGREHRARGAARQLLHASTWKRPARRSRSCRGCAAPTLRRVLAGPAGGGGRGARRAGALARHGAGERSRRGVRGGDRCASAGVRGTRRQRGGDGRAVTACSRTCSRRSAARRCSCGCPSAAPGKLELDNGAVLELGRQDLTARLQRFVAAYGTQWAGCPARPIGSTCAIPTASRCASPGCAGASVRLERS